jgi:hypothetical protein
MDDNESCQAELKKYKELIENLRQTYGYGWIDGEYIESISDYIDDFLEE